MSKAERHRVSCALCSKSLEVEVEEGQSPDAEVAKEGWNWERYRGFVCPQHYNGRMRDGSGLRPL
jgi:hypothetical protein